MTSIPAAAALAAAIAASIALPAAAHVVVTPAQARIGAFQTFAVGVPVEKAVATTGVRLVVPEGLDFVLPNVKPGWKVEAKRADAKAPVTEIRWSGGSIPPGQRDEFVFSAKSPAREATLQWKAYQEYGDGSVVAWDQDPKAGGSGSHAGASGPFSQTRVMDDLKPVEKPADVSLWISIAALLVAAISLFASLRR
jgi:uncharacterized protein YcnI